MVGGSQARGMQALPLVLAFASAVAMFAAVPLLAWPDTSAEPAACGAHQADCFQLNGVTFEGLTVYKPGDLAPLYAGDLMREVGVADLTRIAAAVTDKYRADGYFLSRAVVPPQVRGAGVARIRIYEGYISDVDLTGVGATAVRRHLDGLTTSRPLRLTELDRRLGLASDEPGVQLKTQLEPLIDDPAAHRLVAVATVKPGALSVYVDNRGPRASGPWQAYGNATLNSALAAGDQLALAVLTVPDDVKALTYGELSYALPLGSGARLRGAISLSKARDGASRQSGDIGSNSLGGSLVYLAPLERSRQKNVTAMVTANVRHVEQDWGSGGYDDRVVALRGAISTDRSTPGRSTSLFAQLSAGARSDPRDGRGLSRLDADRRFAKVSARASHYRDINSWSGLYLSAEGQWSPSRLLASEEFVVGGAPTGRGYNYAEIGGDSGLSGTAELRAGFNPKRAGISFLQGYGFVDAGQVFHTGHSGRSAALASAGFGGRMRLGERATLSIEAAKPLTRTPYDRADKGWRPFASLSARF